MDDRGEVKKLLLEGKISSGQATMLLDALRESEERQERISKQIFSQRHKRNKNIFCWFFIGWPLIIALIFIGRWKMNTLTVIFTFIFLLLILSVISIIVLFFYNSLVRREEQVNEAWAQIGTFYQRKLDLVPALLEAVKMYAQHEKETLLGLGEARVRAQQTLEGIGGIAVSDKAKLKKVLESQEGINQGLGGLFALAENYPDLKANVNFLTIQHQLEETEDKIVQEKEIYNNRLREYNSNLRSFPSNLIALLFKFEPKEYFKGKESSAEVN